MGHPLSWTVSKINGWVTGPDALWHESTRALNAEEKCGLAFLLFKECRVYASGGRRRPPLHRQNLHFGQHRLELVRKRQGGV